MADALGGIAAVVTGRVGRSMRRKMRNAALYLCVMILVVTAWLAGVGAIWVLLAAYWGALWAFVMIAGGALGLAAIIIFSVSMMARAEKRRAREEADLWRDALAAAVAILPGLKSKQSLLFAAILGLVMGVTAGTRGPDDET